MNSTVPKKIVKRYSTAFQLKVIREIEQGKYTRHRAQVLYDIGGKSTIAKWLKRHGKQHLLSEVVQVRMKTEKDKVKQLQKRISDLERALADSQVEKIYLQALVQVMDEATGETLKKKAEDLPSHERERLLRLLNPGGSR
jgi:transposase-like protein